MHLIHMSAASIRRKQFDLSTIYKHTDSVDCTARNLHHDPSSFLTEVVWDFVVRVVILNTYLHIAWSMPMLDQQKI